MTALRDAVECEPMDDQTSIRAQDMRPGFRYRVAKCRKGHEFAVGDIITPYPDGTIGCPNAGGWIAAEDVPAALKGVMVVEHSITWSGIVDAILATGYTMQQLSDETGIRYSTLADIKQGRTTEPRGMAAVRLYKVWESL